ncbi:hypothetical protein [Chroococcus sp. FPU101]|uniref:hypothetical protein n=1 Tax=Chroococcus sp. FPU101 TaxID=1974212 RepID=UPI001A8E9892|nr:hypothetical protein [Chroococcus sp. FPU101]GFE69104.1 hypothetical protein CFPU101_17140 [Chroococcus sp. FPU101]
MSFNTTDPVAQAFSLQVKSRQLMGTLTENIFSIASEQVTPFYIDPNELQGEAECVSENPIQLQGVQLTFLDEDEQDKSWIKEVETADFGFTWPEGYPSDLQHLTQVEANVVLLVRFGLHKPSLIRQKWPDHFMEDLQQLSNQEEASVVWNLRATYRYLVYLERKEARTLEEVARRSEKSLEAATFATYFTDGEDISGRDWSDALSNF